MNENAPIDLFDLMSRWDVEAKAIPSYVRRHVASLSATDRRDLYVRRSVLNRILEELRDTMAGMTATYRGIIDGVVVIEADNEDECWARVHDEGTVEFKLCTTWVLTDAAIEHQK